MISLSDWLLGQQGAIFISAVLASIFAYFQIRSARYRTKISSTLEFLSDRQWDRDYIEARKKFIELRERGNLENHAVNGIDAESDCQMAILKILNDYELIAISISKGIMDEEFYKDWAKSTLVRDFKDAQGFINTLNKEETKKRGWETKYYCEFCVLGRKWDGS